MAKNLTHQVCSIAEVTKAVAGGDLTKKIEIDERGEILELKETVNGMAPFPSHKTRPQYPFPTCPS